MLLASFSEGIGQLCLAPVFIRFAIPGHLDCHSLILDAVKIIIVLPAVALAGVVAQWV